MTTGSRGLGGASIEADNHTHKPRKERSDTGQFGKGNSGRPKGAPNKVTKEVREAIRGLVEDHADQMHGWLAKVAETDPAKALDLVLKAAEFAIPKLSRATVRIKDRDDLAEKLRLARERVARDQGESDAPEALPSAPRLPEPAVTPPAMSYVEMLNAKTNAAGEMPGSSWTPLRARARGSGRGTGADFDPFN